MTALRVERVEIADPPRRMAWLFWADTTPAGGPELRLHAYLIETRAARTWKPTRGWIRDVKMRDLDVTPIFARDVPLPADVVAEARGLLVERFRLVGPSTT